MSLSQTKTSPMRTDSARKTSYSRSRSWWRQETFWWMTWSSSDWGQSCWGARASVRPSKTETSTATFWSAASMRDCQTRECVSVFLCLWRLFSHLWRRCNPITIHLKPIIHPPTWPSIARTHIPRNERMNYRQEWQKWKERDDFFRCEVGLLPSARTSRLWSARVSNSEWRTHVNPMGMKSSRFIHEINHKWPLHGWVVERDRQPKSHRRQRVSSLHILWCESDVRRE